MVAERTKDLFPGDFLDSGRQSVPAAVRTEWRFLISPPEAVFARTRDPVNNLTSQPEVVAVVWRETVENKKNHTRQNLFLHDMKIFPV